jgi:hypothetical protein
LETWLAREPQSVTVQTGQETGSGEPLPRLDRNNLTNASRGWSFADGVLTVKVVDRFEPTRFTIQH